MSFIFRKNIGLVTGAGALFNLKELLKTAGWTVKSSGDGLSLFSSSSDILTTASSGAGGLGNANAWFRIQMPSYLGVTREMLLQMSGISNVSTLTYSYSAGYTGGSPSATVIPTATDSQNIRGTFTGFLSDNSYHVNMGADNAAPYGFFLAIISDGNPGSAPGGGIVLDAIMANTGSPNDPDPFVWTVPGTNGFSIGNVSSASGGGAWFGKGTPAEAWSACNPLGVGNPSAGNFMFPNLLGINPHSMDEEVGPVIYGHNTTTSEPIGIKGVGYVMMWHGMRKQSGQLLSYLSTGDRIVISDVNLPWDGTPVAV